MPPAFSFEGRWSHIAFEENQQWLTALLEANKLLGVIVDLQSEMRGQSKKKVYNVIAFVSIDRGIKNIPVN